MPTASKKVENNIESAANKAAEQLNSASDMLRNYFTVLNTAGRAAFEGTVEVDKLILNKLGDAVRETAEHGRELMSVRDLNAAVSMYANFAEARLNKSVADTKEVLDLAKSRAENVIEPFKAYA